MPSSTNQLKALRQKLKLLLRSRLCFTIYLVLTMVLLAFGSLPVEANTFLSGCNGAILSWSCVLTVYNFIFAIAASMAVVALGWWGFILTVPGIDQNRRFTGIQHFRSVIIGLLILGSIFAIFNTFSGNLITNRPGTESLINPGGEPITAGEQPAFIPSSQNKKNYQASQQASQNSSGSSTTSEKEDKKGKLAEKIARVLKDGQKDNNIENVVFSEEGAMDGFGGSGNGSGSNIETNGTNSKNGTGEPGSSGDDGRKDGMDTDDKKNIDGVDNQEGDDETDPVLIPKLNKQPKPEADPNKNTEQDSENGGKKEKYSFERIEPTSRFPTAEDLKKCIGDDQATDLGCINNLQINENIQIEGLTQEEQKSFVDWVTGTAEKVREGAGKFGNVARIAGNIAETWGLGGMGDIFGKFEKGARTAGSVAKKVERGGEIIRDINNNGLTYKQLRQITAVLPPGSYKQKYIYPAIKTAEDIEDLKKEGKPTTFYESINYAKNTADIIGGLPVIGPTKTANKVIATLGKVKRTARYTEEIQKIATAKAKIKEEEEELRNQPEIYSPIEFDKTNFETPPIVQVQNSQPNESNSNLLDPEYQVTSYEIGDVELTPLSGNNIYAVIEAIPCTHRIGKTIEKCKTQDPETYFVELQPDSKNPLTSTQNSQKIQEQLTKLKGQRYAGCLFGPESAQKLIDNYLMPALLGVCPKDASIDIGDQSYRAQVLQGDWRQTT